MNKFACILVVATSFWTAMAARWMYARCPVARGAIRIVCRARSMDLTPSVLPH